MRISKKMMFLAGVVCLMLIGTGGLGCKKEKKAEESASATETANSSSKGDGKPTGEMKDSNVNVGKVKVDMNRFRYVVEMDSPGQGRMKLEYAIDKPRMNMRLSMKEGDGDWQFASHLVSDGKDLYVLEPNSKTAMKMPLNDEIMEQMVPDEMVFTPDLDSFTEEIGAENLEKMGKESLNGLEVTKYKMTEAGAPGTMYLFVDDNNIIRRFQIEGEEESFTMNVLEIDADPKFGEEDFTMPAGYQITDMGSMMTPQ